MVTSSWVGLVWTTVVALVSMLSTFTEAVYLNEYILDYQPLQFDHTHLHEKHSRVRREVDPALRWNFKAYGRTFKLHLVPDRSVFAEDHTVEFAGRMEPAVDTGFFYRGSLTDVPGSTAHMAIHAGHLWGEVAIPGHTTYFIEPAAHHRLGTSGNGTADFHTIIYPESRMNLDPYRHKRQNAGTCRTELFEKLKRMSQPVDSADTRRHRREASFDRNPYEKYSSRLNSGLQGEAQRLHARFRRAAGELTSTNNKTCFMQLRADQLLYQHYLEKYGSDVEKTKEVILSLFASHIKALSNIFEDTTFQDGSTIFTGLNFVLQRSTIITECNGVGNYDQHYCQDNLDVSNYLDLTSETPHNEFCLVHTFTYRDFMGGTLGLAWVAEPDSPNAGFCGKYGRIRDSEKGVVSRSLNTGIVTLINYNREVPSRVSQITFTHEVGHNFGAQHDTTPECAPYDTNRADANDGNYIMFPNAIPGTMPNNKKFSPCSRTSIARVLQSVGGIRTNCFLGSDEAFCGNNIVEEGEECDCGYKAECTDNCCNGRDGLATDCKLVTPNSCSPSQGLCCSSLTCQPHDTSFRCDEATDCTQNSFCDGTNAVCPQPVLADNFTTFCNDHLAVCELGECIASVCRNIGWQECFKTSAGGSSDEELCYISCRETENSECISSLDEEKVAANSRFADLLQTIKGARNSSSNGVKRPPGSACDDFNGYCDVFSKCRKVDAEGPFKQLTDLIFNEVTFENIRDWIKSKWWAVLLMCVGVVIFMGVFVWVFGYNTPSEDPRKKRRDQRGGRGGQAGGRRVDKRSAPYTTQMPMQERRPQHGGATPGGGAGPASYDNHGYDHRYDNRHSSHYDSRHSSHYDNRHSSRYDPGGYHPPPPYQSAPPPPKGQQFDRIYGQRY